MNTAVPTHTLAPVRIDPNVPQRRAADPDRSVSVGASAGSGKTKVLTDRVLRLLLPREDGRPGTPPHRILCLTFTKAGAAEMLQRINDYLSRWAVIPDSELASHLSKLTGRTASTDDLSAARRLFAAVVDTPGGLKVMTIHSFCQSVLGRFPLEAGLPPHFTVIDETQAVTLMSSARDEVLRAARDNPDSALGLAVTRLAALQNEDQFSQLLGKLSGERRQLSDILKDPAAIRLRLCEMFQMDVAETEGTIIAAACEDAAFNPDGLYAACRALATGNNTDQKNGLNIQLWLDSDLQKRMATFDDYTKILLTKEYEFRKKLVGKDVQNANPDCAVVLQTEAERLFALQDRLKAAHCIACTHDLLLIGNDILEAYNRLKGGRAALDYDDLILKTRDLLRQPAIAPWILFKLDGGLDHVLVDEAQDTNPEQWDIINALCDDFASGLNARDEVIRSIFTVGDEKQSIYSFQRASPAEFAKNRVWMREKLAAEDVQMDVSFRSTSAVLGLVDETFAPPHLREGLSEKPVTHYSFREGQAGHCELWPVFAPDDAAPEEPWTPPVTIVEAPSGQTKLADYVGKTIEGWIRDGEILPSHGRPVRPGDIMILVRTRTAFVGQLVRALKTRGIPVSGVDRMVLGDQIAVMDLLALARFALLPADDLSLAAALRSPLIGIDEDELFHLAHNRTATLWQSVRDGAAPETVAWLSDLLRHAASDHPYEFFSRILQRPCPADPAGSGKRAMLKRLGADALDPMDEFLGATLSFERDNIPTLQGFLIWQQQGDITIKREMEEAGNAVRIMTVHGSKGLQAPIVILPDTTRTGSSRKTDTLIWPDKTGLPLPLWAPRSADFPALYQTARARLETALDEEYRRLLYVAMTRAEDRLYVGGYRGKQAPMDGCWYNYIKDAFERLPNAQTRDGLLVLSHPQNAAPDRAEKNSGPKERLEAAPPTWLFEPAGNEPFPPRPLVPSRPAEPEPAARSPLDGDAEYRFKRGNITHKLLQILPDLPQAERRRAAAHYVSRPSHELSQTVQDSIIAETMAILDHPDYAPLFGPGSLAEVPLTGFVNGRLVSAQIDRLLITDTEIRIVDYKSNRPPPIHEQDVPAAYRSQMQSYRDIVAKIYPARPIRCFLLWTDGPILMELQKL